MTHAQPPAMEAALAALRAGRFIIVTDDAERENEGDLVLAAEHATPETMAFCIRYTGGVVCAALSNTIADRLKLPPMVTENSSRYATAFTVSVDARDGITTGISAADRARTVQLLADPATRPEDLVRPGHIFPLRADDRGVLGRVGHTEASVDLCRMAGLREAAVISEMMHDDGTMMRLAAIRTFAVAYGIPLISVADVIAARSQG